MEARMHRCHVKHSPRGVILILLDVNEMTVKRDYDEVAMEPEESHYKSLCEATSGAAPTTEIKCTVEEVRILSVKRLYRYGTIG